MHLDYGTGTFGLRVNAVEASSMSVPSTCGVLPWIHSQVCILCPAQKVSLCAYVVQLCLFKDDQIYLLCHSTDCLNCVLAA